LTGRPSIFAWFLNYSDENRIPWLEELSKFISQHENIVLSCSALKKMYRRILTGKLDNPEKCRIIMLQVPRQYF
jgi:gluconate kinase